jgi:hypothetical protein
MLLQLPPDKEVESLVGASEFNIRLHCDRVIALAKRVEQLVNGDRLTTTVALGKIIALEHPCDRVQGRKANHPRRTKGLKPD